MSSGFTSGEELMRARNRDQCLPSTGVKLEEATGSWLEERQLEARLQEHQALLQEPKVTRKDQLATGEWLPESQMVKIIHHTGKFWHHMGAETDIGKCLYPEEALYLIETAELEVAYGGTPLSFQQAQVVLLRDAHCLDQYLVYSHLSRAGCKVVRHQPHLIFTKYEKEIRIDQHQADRKGMKLKLKPDTDSHHVEKTVNDAPSQPSSVDEAMKELYECLGEAAENPLQSGMEGTSSSAAPECVTKAAAEKRSQHGSEKRETPYETKRREFLGMFPCSLGKEVIFVEVEPAALLPKNCSPAKRNYQISLEALEYYSIYDSRLQHSNHHTHRNWNKQGWNRRDRNGCRGSHTNEANWRSRGDSRSAWGHGDRSDYRHRSQGGRDFEPAWRDARNGRWGSAEESNWRAHNYHEPVRDPWEADEQGRYSENQAETTDFSMRPQWKRKRRIFRRQQGRDYYPSSLMKLKTRVRSWKEYKELVSEMSTRQQLTQGSTRVLWEGRTTPLLSLQATSSSSSTKDVLSTCSLGTGVTEFSTYKERVPKEAQLEVLYDVYLPSVPYKKSNPSIPNKRVTVMRDGGMPNPGQILEVTSRFMDKAEVVCAVVMCGEVRLYTLTPLTLPPPHTAS